MTARRPFSPAKDAYIVANYSKKTLKDMALELDRHWGSVQQHIDLLIKAGKLSRRDRLYRPRWTEGDDEYLNESWGISSDKAVTKHLGRSINACNLRADRTLGISRKTNIYSMRQVARIFGVDDKTPLRWAGRGWVKCKRAGYKTGPNRVWNFDHESIERFITTMSWAYDWRRMGEEGYFTELARRVNHDDPWLTFAEACSKMGWNHAHLERWYRRGFLPFKWRPKQQKSGDQRGLIVVRKSDLPDFLRRVQEAVHQNRVQGARRRCATRADD